MSATDEVRRMLDERGAKYKEYGGVTKGAMESYSRFIMYGDDGYARAIIEADSRDEVLLMLRCSAEHAVDALLDGDTCAFADNDGYTADESVERIARLVELGAPETCRVTDTGFATVVCSECGCEYMGSIITNEPPDYVKPLERCPNCGRRVVP